MKKARIFLISRCLIVLIQLLTLGTLFLAPANTFLYLLDILARTYFMFLGCVMAHEGVHGHLAHTKRGNFWWARVALIPTMVPFTNFRKTHQLHHLYTNDPAKDPDYFINARYSWQILLRALAMPHHWYFWLKSRGRVSRSSRNELVLNYAAIFVLYAIISHYVGLVRLLAGMLPPLVLVSMLLWYPFAYKTHEGFSMGSAEVRSHDYYGLAMFWFSLGLSLHRVHHLKPELSWIELRRFVPVAASLIPRRDVRFG